MDRIPDSRKPVWPEQRNQLIDKTNDFNLTAVMAEIISRLDVLQSLLRVSLPVSDVKRREFPVGWVTADEVIVTHRFLIIESGKIDYTVERRTMRLQAGAQFFVPAWCRREWTVPKGAGVCRLLWCEFSSGAVTMPPVLCWRRPKALRFEEAAFRGMLRLIEAKEDRSKSLQLEGQLKACLARFWCEAETMTGEEGPHKAVHSEVTRAIAWLENHYAEADALEVFYRTVELSPNHFRLLFRGQTGETVQAVLARLRLRRARYLVQETTLPMKRIAAQTGFADPLYFSNQYRKFWGRAPTADRVGSGVA
jgi:AraC-like DNA-binding protein